MKIFKFLALPLVALLAFSCSDNNNGEEPPPVTETLNVEHQPLTYTWDSKAEITVSVKTNSEEDFTAVPDKDWIKVTAIDQENKTFKVSVTEYTEEDADPRTGEITVSVGKATPKKITVTQTSRNKTIPVDYTIKVTPEAKLAFDADKDLVKTLTVVCVNEVAVDIDDEYKDWLEAKLEGETLTVTVKENQEWEPATGRKGEIVLSAENTTDVKVEITQKAAEEIDPALFPDLTGTWMMTADAFVAGQPNILYPINQEVTIEYKSYQLPSVDPDGEPIEVGPYLVLNGLGQFLNEVFYYRFPDSDWPISFDTDSQRRKLIVKSLIPLIRSGVDYCYSYLGGRKEALLSPVVYPWEYDRMPGAVNFESSMGLIVNPELTRITMPSDLSTATYSAKDPDTGQALTLTPSDLTVNPLICYYDQTVALDRAGSIWVAIWNMALTRPAP